MHTNNTIHKIILLFLVITSCMPAYAQIRVGLWEPAINVTKKEKSIFINPKEIQNGIDDDENGIIDDVAGTFFTTKGKLAGKSFLHDTVNTNLTEHGWAVYQVLSKGIADFKIAHAGFTPLTQHLRETGILNLSVEERKSNLAKEYKYFRNFVTGEIQTKNLRAIYGCIAMSKFNKDTNKSNQRYLAEILGHSDNDLNTANSYIDFKSI